MTSGGVHGQEVSFRSHSTTTKVPAVVTMMSVNIFSKRMLRKAKKILEISFKVECKNLRSCKKYALRESNHQNAAPKIPQQR